MEKGKETKDGKKIVDLDELQKELEKTLSLLENRQPGLMSWNTFLKERLQNINKMTSVFEK
ncbi:hypothetical protein KKH36_03730 [Patescibacteria group bacterium]|nr:hypothetical protein [Patescibacteria group bacterium]